MFGKRKQPPSGVAAFQPPPPRIQRVVAPPPAVVARPVEIEIVAAPQSASVAPLIAYVLATSVRPLSPEHVVKSARVLWPAMPAISAYPSGDGASVITDAKGEMCGATMFVTQPFPAGELRAAAASAMGWPTVAEDIKTHRAHAIISVTHPDPARAHMLLTYLTAAALQDTGATGVYWSNTDALIPADSFLDEARRMDGPPALLWCKVHLRDATTAAGETGVLAYTSGLMRLGLKDYECVCTRDELDEFMFAHLYGNASGAITRGDQEPDGTTREIKGDDLKRPFEVSYRHTVSIRDDGGDVITLNLHRA